MTTLFDDLDDGDADGLQGVPFHDGRHTAITMLVEKGLPDSVIQAQLGHVAPEMMKTYSHIRRLGLNQAAAALEPTATTTPAPPATRSCRSAASSRQTSYVTVHVTIHQLQNLLDTRRAAHEAMTEQ